MLPGYYECMKSRDTDPVIEVYKKDVDRTLLRENLKLTVEERFERLQQLQILAEELRAGMKKAHDNRLQETDPNSGSEQG